MSSVAGAVSMPKKRALQGGTQGGEPATDGTVVEVAAEAQAAVPQANAVEGHVWRDTSATEDERDTRRRTKSMVGGYPTYQARYAHNHPTDLTVGGYPWASGHVSGALQPRFAHNPPPDLRPANGLRLKWGCGGFDTSSHASKDDVFLCV